MDMNFVIVTVMLSCLLFGCSAPCVNGTHGDNNWLEVPDTYMFDYVFHSHGDGVPEYCDIEGCQGDSKVTYVLAPPLQPPVPIDVLVGAVKLLLEEAIERNEPSKFEIESHDMYSGDTMYITPFTQFTYTYKAFFDGVWKEVSEDEFDRLRDADKARQEQRIIQMKSLLDILEMGGK